MSENHKHEFEEVYYGLKCKHCDLFYPDNGNYFAPLDDEEEEYHPYNCTCEDCLQNHPERDILYGDGDYFNWGDNDEEVETVICARCGEEYPAENKECTSCGLSRVGRWKDDDENSGVPA